FAKRGRSSPFTQRGAFGRPSLHIPKHASHSDRHPHFHAGGRELPERPLAFLTPPRRQACSPPPPPALRRQSRGKSTRSRRSRTMRSCVALAAFPDLTLRHAHRPRSRRRNRPRYDQLRDRLAAALGARRPHLRGSLWPTDLSFGGRVGSESGLVRRWT